MEGRISKAETAHLPLASLASIARINQERSYLFMAFISNKSLQIEVF